MFESLKKFSLSFRLVALSLFAIAVLLYVLNTNNKEHSISMNESNNSHETLENVSIQSTEFDLNTAMSTTTNIPSVQTKLLLPSKISSSSEANDTILSPERKSKAIDDILNGKALLKISFDGGTNEMLDSEMNPIPISLLDEVREIASSEKSQSNGESNIAPHNKIFYTGFDDETYKIYSINDDSSQKKRLTSLKYSQEVNPKISPLRDKVLYTDYLGDQIYVVDVNGENNKLLVESSGNRNISPPTWSHDGKSIIYSTSEGFVSMNIETGVKTAYPGNPSSREVISISPDGKKLAYAEYTSSQYKIYISDLYGNNSRHVNINTKDTGVRSLSWSPNGKSLIYLSEINERNEIKKINLENLEVKQLTNDGRNKSSPSFSEDGKRIVYSACMNKDYQGCLLLESSITIINADGSGTVNIAIGDSPDW